MTADSVWRPLTSGPRDHGDLADHGEVLSCTPPDARHQRTAGPAGGGAQEAGLRSVQLFTSPEHGCTPELYETASTVVDPPEALLAWSRQHLYDEGTEMDATSAVNHDAGAGTTGRPNWARHERAEEEGGAGGRGSSPHSPRSDAVPPGDRTRDHRVAARRTGRVQLGPRLAAALGVDVDEHVCDQVDAAAAGHSSVHWIPYEYREGLRPPTSANVQNCGDDAAAERRAGAEVGGWRAVAGHQRHNTGWSARHRRNRPIGGGLEVEAATADERRIGHRIRHCGERLVFRAPNCECDPYARPSLVGANLCTHRMCHHCSRLRSRKLAGRVRDRVDELRIGGIRRFALLTLTYRDGESLEGSIDRCWKDFRTLRNRALWRSVLGSVATIEIKRGERSGLWHPHLHVLLARPSCDCLRGRRPDDYGQFCIHGRISCPHALNQCCIVEAWREITGDSYVIDIRAVRADSEGDMGGAIREVVKYCTKLTEVDPTRRHDGLNDVLELHRAIRKRRLLITTGVFRGLREAETAEELLDDPEAHACVFCGTRWESVAAIWDDRLDRYVVRAIPTWERAKAPSRGPTPGIIPSDRPTSWCRDD